MWYEDVGVGEILDNVGEIIYDLQPELTELVEEGNKNKEILDKLKEFHKHAIELRELVYKEFYKDE